jgi:hypothetical protein
MRATVEELVQRWKDEWPRSEDRTALQNNANHKSGPVHRPRLGIGLALCNIFTRWIIYDHLIMIEAKKTDCFRYFGGSLELVSLDGWGEATNSHVGSHY